MAKIKLSERQVLMLQNIQEENSKQSKVLKITESQYKRLFKESFPKGKAIQKLSKRIEKSDMEENTKKIDLVDFAQEVIVFIKDILSKSDPRKIPYSPYWSELGISKGQLFNLIKKHGLLALADEQSEIREYAAPKHGFRKKIKELFNTISEFGDAGYPAGAQNDPNAPWNQPDPDPEAEVEIIRIPEEEKKFRILHFGEDGMSIFKAGNELFAVCLCDIGGINEDPEEWDNKIYMYDYKEPHTDDITPRGLEDYINDKYNQKEIKPVRNDATDKFPIPTLITPIVKSKILNWYSNDPKMVEILNQMPESTGAASSGAYVAGASFGRPNEKDTGSSPEEAMGELINDGIDPSGVVQFYSKKTDEVPFIIDGVKWLHVWGIDSNGKKDNAVYKYGQDITYSLDWFENNILKRTHETTSTGTVGAGVSIDGQGTQTDPQYAYDAPAGDGKNFWTAGNKKMGKNGTPIVRGGIKENLKVGQVYKNGLARRKVINIKNNPLKQTIIHVRQWGDEKGSRDLKITPKEWGHWELIHEGKKVLQITQEQFNKILESENMTKTAFPNGEMIDFDDCVKFNNNTKAQDGGCSQGAVDNVVKKKKTKGSVVAEEFNANVGAGSIFAIEVTAYGAKVQLKDERGNSIVVHHDDIPDLIKRLKEVY